MHYLIVCTRVDSSHAPYFLAHPSLPSSYLILFPFSFLYSKTLQQTCLFSPSPTCLFPFSPSRGLLSQPVHPGSSCHSHQWLPVARADCFLSVLVFLDGQYHLHSCSLSSWKRLLLLASRAPPSPGGSTGSLPHLCFFLIPKCWCAPGLCSWSISLAHLPSFPW